MKNILKILGCIEKNWKGKFIMTDKISLPKIIKKF